MERASDANNVAHTHTHTHTHTHVHAHIGHWRSMETKIRTNRIVLKFNFADSLHYPAQGVKAFVSEKIEFESSSSVLELS